MATAPIPSPPRPRRRPRLRTVLFAVNITLLLLPAGGIALMRIYENELVRRTQAELIAQGAVMRAAYAEALIEALGGEEVLQSYGRPVSVQFRQGLGSQEILQPLAAELDVASDPVHAPASDPPPAAEPAADAAAAVAAARLAPILERARLTTLAGVRVVDHRGVVVATTRGELGASLVGREEVRRALTGEPTSLMRRRISDEPAPSLDSIRRRKLLRVFVALPIRHENRVLGAVVLSRTPMSMLKGLYVDRGTLILFAVLLMAVVLLITAFTSLTINGPVRRLIHQTDRIKQGGGRSTGATIDRPVTHEFAQLSQSFADMARTLEERSDYIKTFASAVSHEFKTPLASIRGTVELLQDHLEEMSDEERQRFLDILLADAERLERLVRRLLELARADVLRPREYAASDIEPVLGEVIARQQAAGLNVSLHVEGPLAPVMVSRETLESCLSNLLANARQHGGPDVLVRVSARSTEGGAEIVVADDGPGISSNNVARVFDAFFTTDRAGGGTGVGLSVVRSLLRAHGGDVELLQGGTPDGATFRIILARVSAESRDGGER